MVMATFNPTLTPDEAMKVDVEPRIKELTFGDGYMQEMQDGINNVQRDMSPKWTNARKAEADSIIVFLEPRARTREPFYWTPNGESAPRSIKCTRLSYAWKKGRFCDLTAEFKETAARA